MESTASFSNDGKLRELHEEEERMKLRMLQADAGLIGGKDLLATAERMDWMYHNPAAQAKKENEDYLLGKSLATTDEREEMRKRLGVGTTAAGSLFLSSVTTQNDDTLRRLREDPLFIIRQAEHRQRRIECSRQRILGSASALLTGPSTTQQSAVPKQKRTRPTSHDEKDNSTTERSRLDLYSGKPLRDRHTRSAEFRRHSHGEHRNIPPSESPIISKICERSPSTTQQSAVPKQKRTRPTSHDEKDNTITERSQLDLYSRKPLRDRHTGSTEFRRHPHREHRNIPPSESPIISKISERSPARRHAKRSVRSVDSWSSSDKSVSGGRQSGPSQKKRDCSRNNSQETPDIQHELSPHSVTNKVIKGPVRPVEWERMPPPQQISENSATTLKDGEHPRKNGYSSDQGGSDSDASSDDLGPPLTMASSLRQLRESKGATPTLWKSRKDWNPMNPDKNTTPTPGSLPTRGDRKRGGSESPPPGVGKKDNTEKKDTLNVFELSKKALMEEERKAKLKAMIEEGKRHEADKNVKLSHVEKIERLQESLEQQKRVTTLDRELPAQFIKTTTKDAYMDENVSLQDRLKRYAARRQRTLLEQNELEDEVK